jgi:beta-N-acetylhexosaminidase
VALAALVTAAVAAIGVQQQLAAMTPREKAALVVVSGLPAPRGVGGVLVQRWSRSLPRPRGALVFADQEGGPVRAFQELPPPRPASAYRSTADARAAGLAAGAALRRAGVHVDLAPVLDAPDGPLGSRHFREGRLGVAFARGLIDAGAGACAKHFPGLGSAAVSTDERPHVDARERRFEIDVFAAAIRAGVPCVMTSNAFYGRRFRATIEPATYRRLRALGFRGVAITDSLSILRHAPVERWARQAVRAGADLVLFASPAFARRAISALTPLAARGELDAHVRRVILFRGRFLG